MEETCVICDTSSFHIPFVDQDVAPIAGSQNGAPEIRQAFATFCKVLKLDRIIRVKNRRRFETLNEYAFGPAPHKPQPESEVFPCCLHCYEVLAEISKLQKVIDETKIVQQNLAKTLKDLVCKHNVNDDQTTPVEGHISWRKRIRNELIDFCTSAEFSDAIVTGQHKRKRGSDMITNEETSFQGIATKISQEKLNHIDNFQSQPKRPEISRPKIYGKEQDVEVDKVAPNPANLVESKLHLIKPCSVVVKRLELKPAPSIKESDPSEVSTQSDCDLKIDASFRRSRQSKLKAYEFIRRQVSVRNENDDGESMESFVITHRDTADDEFQATEEKLETFEDGVRGEVKEDSCEVDPDYEHDDFFESIDEDDTSSIKDDDNKYDPDEFSSKAMHFRDVKDVDTKRRRNRSNKFFYRVEKNIMLCHSSLVKFTDKTLTCLEPCCSFIIEGSDFTSFQNMLSHIQDTHLLDYSTDTKRRTCPVCQQQFHNAPVFRNHLISTHGVIKRLLCEVCKKELRTSASLMKHYRVYHKSGLEGNGRTKGLKKVRAEKVPRISYLRQAKKSSKRQFVQVQDDACNLPLKRKNRTSRYFFTVDEGNTLLCRSTLVKCIPKMLTCLEPDCSTAIEGSDFAAFQNMLCHIQDAHEVEYSTKSKKRTCPICQKVFHEAPEFRHHLLKEHKIIERMLCEVCKKEFKNTSKLLYHCRMHHEEELISLEEKLKNKPHVKEKQEMESLKLRLEGRGVGINNVEDLRSLWKSKKMERQRKKYGKTKSKQDIGKCERAKFFVIKDDILCCRGSLVKVSPRNLICLDSNCSFNIEGCSSKLFKNMSDHISFAHENNDKRNICPLCNEEFGKREEFKSHLRNQHEVNRVMCPKCRKGVACDSFKKHSCTLPKQTQVSKWGANDTFFVFGENWMWMMYKYSVFLRSPAHFHCREEGCGENIPINGSFDYFAFENVRKHVDEVHGTASSQDQGGGQESCFCPQCALELKDRLSLRTHIMQSHGARGICPSCFKILQIPALGDHRWAHFNEEERSAAIAAGEKDKLTELKLALKTAAPTFLCQKCPKRFKTRTQLQAHEVTHIPKELRPKLKCPEENCNVEVLSKVALQSHIDRQHKPELVTRHLVCKICSKRFHVRDGHSYRVHLRSHLDERPFICDKCPKRFCSLARLKMHTGVHSTTRLYQCEYCAMSYKWPRNLKRHRETAHKDIVPSKSFEEKLKDIRNPECLPGFIGPRQMYPCTWCDKPFELRSRMKKHALVCLQRGEDEPTA